MTISAKIICDSISPRAVRITTLQLRYPRFIHAEFMTHRQFSRNASSSRAVPVEKLIKDIQDDPVYPSFWGANQKGMQAAEECDTKVAIRDPDTESYWYVDKTEAWNHARSNAIILAKSFSDAGYHKQIVNRLLEPFSHINVVVTSTEWSNFFALRIHKDAQPEIRILAEAMKNAIDFSTPIWLNYNSWHVPYATNEDWVEINGGGVLTPDQTLAMIKISVARCARVSYLTHEMKSPKIEDDLKLYDRLLGAHPIHASPAEHQATPSSVNNTVYWGNFKGWIQYRKTLSGECQ